MAIINGNKNANTINGTSGNDIINGLGGADKLFGLDGDDTLDGGDNEDRLDGGNGRDILIGGAGRDILLGGAGNDFLNGGLADDQMDGGTGTDTITYTGLESEYRIVNRSGIVTVTDRNIANGNDGTDTITNAERIQFADHTIFLVPDNAPVAAGDSYSIDEDNVLTVTAAAGVLANDSDADGDPITAILVGTGPAHGSLVLNPDGSFIYTPVANFNGADSFTYRANDGFANSNTVTVNLTVNPLNDAPVAVGNGFSLNEDGSVSFSLLDLLANDSDPDGDLFSFFDFVGAPAHGQLIDNGGGSYSYVPAANFNGQDSLGYSIQDNSGATSNTATITFTVAPVNDPPVALDDRIVVAPNGDTGNLVAVLLANDSDVDGDGLFIPSGSGIAVGPSHGELGTFVPLSGDFYRQIHYLPGSGFVGTDSFTYLVSDGHGGTDTATVSIIVDNAPVAAADSATTDEDNAKIINVLGNDSDADAGQTLTPTVVANAGHGNAVVNPDGTITYTPAANFHGADSFTYKLSDGLLDSNVVTVSLTVNSVNDIPVAGDDTFHVLPGGEITLFDDTLLANDTDADGDALAITGSTLTANGSLGEIVELNTGRHGFEFFPEGFVGATSFTYTVSDGHGGTDTATVHLIVDNAPVAVADSDTTNEDTAKFINVLGNDSDPDAGQTLTPIIVDHAGHGSVFVQSNGTIKYTPAADYNGPDSFTYKLNDGLLESNVVTVSLTVTPVNDAPEAVDNAYTINEDSVLNVAAAGVLANDLDIEGNALTALLVAGPSHGTLTLNSNGSFSYTPAANYNGADSFTYRANDGALNSNIATVDITINPVADPPIAVGESLTRANVNGVVTLNWADLLANDSDPDGTPVAITLAHAMGLPSPGPDDPATVETAPDGNAYIVHVPKDFAGTFQLFYAVISGGDLSSEVFASVTVPGTSGPTSAASFVGPDSDVIVTPDLFV